MLVSCSSPHCLIPFRQALTETRVIQFLATLLGLQAPAICFPRSPVLVLKVYAATLGLVYVCCGPGQLLLFEYQVLLPTDNLHKLKRRIITQWVRNIILRVQNDKVWEETTEDCSQ